MKQIQPFQKHWLQITSIVVWRLNDMTVLVGQYPLPAWKENSQSQLWRGSMCQTWTHGIKMSVLVIYRRGYHKKPMYNIYAIVYHNAEGRKSMYLRKRVYKGTVQVRSKQIISKYFWSLEQLKL